MAVPLGALGSQSSVKNQSEASTVFVTPSLLSAAQAHPRDTFSVIVQGTGSGKNSDKVARNVGNFAAHADEKLANSQQKSHDDAGRARQKASDLATQAAQAQQDSNGRNRDSKNNDSKASRLQSDANAAAAAAAQAASDAAAADAAISQASNDIVKQDVKDQFLSISGVSVTLTGKQILKLYDMGSGSIVSITPDATIKASGYQNNEMWRISADVTSLWNATDPNTGLVTGPAPKTPGVAIVDSGVDGSKLGDFGKRLVANINLSSLSPGATGDAEGHGTMVAGVLAGSSPAYPGVAPNAPIVSIRTADAKGESVTSDVIKAADWILANKDLYNIRVANFSMAGATSTSFRFDPLDKAVEKLWFNGIVVIAAAGNHGTGTGPVNMSYAPGNDPFVITVGAVDQNLTMDPLDDTVPSWSAYGHTVDGFSKPDLVAPGRYIIAPVPMGSTLATTVPDRVVAPGYMWMSGTSFSAPVVAGAALQMLARHPDWGPNEVKGALMLTSNYLSLPGMASAGVGEIDAAYAASLDFTPPNPNENLDTFVSTDPKTGATMFDQASWDSAVKSADGSWTQASWNSASWDSASWDSASWDSASWDSASWDSNVASAMHSLVTTSEATFAP